MSDATKIDKLDAVTAHDLREQGSLKWTRFGGDTIGAFVAEMDFGTAPAVIQAMHAAVAGTAFGYLPPALADELARACARWQQERYGWRVQPEHIYPLSDVLTALEVAMRHFTRPGSPVILPTPAYMPFLTVPPQHGREVIQVPMANEGDRYVLDLDGIDRAYRAGGRGGGGGGGGDLLILCNPANPVGRVFTADELAGVTEVVDRHGGRVFADEVHAPLVFSGHHHVPYASTSDTAAAHTLTATSASKAWNLSGLKCAQVILAPADVGAWREVGLTASVAASTPGVIASTAAYRSGGPWLDEVLRYLDRNRRTLGELLAAHLPWVGYQAPEGTYLAWLGCRELARELAGEPGGASAGEPGGDYPLSAFLRDQAGLAVVDGAECGEAGRGYVRLNFATPQPILKRALTRIAHAYDRRPTHPKVDHGG